MTRSRFLPYNQPEVGEEEAQAVSAVIQSRWLTHGDVTRRFEEALAARVGVSSVVALSSCTAALHLALLGYHIGEGDEVITTPMTFVASVNAVIQTGATPVLVDIDPVSGNIDLNAVAEAINSRTRAILPVHYGGHPVDMAQLNGIRDTYHLAVVEDAAHGLGSFSGGQPLGSFGNLTAFSFYATKNLTTAEGGALCVENAEVEQEVRALSLHGMTRNSWNRYQRGGSWQYDVTALGYKYNMSDVQAALGLVQLKKLTAMQSKRAALAQRYQEKLSCLPLQLPGTEGHSWHLYSVGLDLKRIRGDRNDVIDDLRQANIGTSVHFIPIYRHTYYRSRFGWGANDFPHTEAFFQGRISLPLYPSMTIEDVDDVAHALDDSLSARRV